MLIPNEMPINNKVTKNIMTLRHILDFLGKPTFYHFISSGSGALEMVTYLMGKVLSEHKFHKFFQDGRGFNF